MILLILRVDIIDLAEVRDYVKDILVISNQNNTKSNRILPYWVEKQFKPPYKLYNDSVPALGNKEEWLS